LEAASPQDLKQSYWRKIVGRLESAEQSPAIRTIVDIALGNFIAFEEPDDGPPIAAHEELAARTMGLNTRGRHTILGNRLKLRESLEAVLRLMSDRSNRGRRGTPRPQRGPLSA
jgi:hypothetical protein